ncbi:hypothetical protein [Marinospirillum insulare]|uniref:hypothetical protein n=1 Tax=Marinospirillum insulare TaxID=217169 RepID=UPI0024E06956|nr:hypothetical protein [Marinospirillum insulare]
MQIFILWVVGAVIFSAISLDTPSVFLEVLVPLIFCLIAVYSLKSLNQQPATSNQQPATSNQQPATSNQQPATT